MSNMDAMHAARLVNLESALLALLREFESADPQDAPDGLTVHAQIEDGQSVIEVEFLRGGFPIAGESL